MRDITKVLAEMRKQHGEDIIRKASDLPLVKMFPSKLPILDYYLGGGIPVGRTTIVAGRENSGKTSLACLVGGNFQNVGIPVFYVDMDKLFDPERAKLFGLDPEETYVVRGELTAENVYETVRDLIRVINTLKDTRAFFVIDSIANMVSEALFEKSASEQYGGSARMINQSVQIWQLLLKENQTMFLINQFRAKVGEMTMDKDSLPGGLGQLYVASTIVHLRAGATLKDGTAPIGQEVKFTIKKSKTSNPKETGTIKFYYQTGFEVIENLIDTAFEMDLLETKGGGYYKIPGTDEEIRGKDKFVAKVRDDKEFMTKLYDLVYSKMNMPIWDGKNVSPETIDE